MPDDGALDLTGRELVFADDFTGPVLDEARWLPHYLPHWTTPDRSAARYRTGPDGLELRIDADQPAWRPEDAPLRVSNLQTGMFAGPVGSAVGMHRHRADLPVRTPYPTRRLWTPSSGVAEVTMAATADPACLLAFWLVGLEEGSPRDSGEICVAELFGHAVGPAGSTVRLGVKAHHDPRLTTDMVDLRLDLDATEQHRYAAEWDARRVRYFVDGALVRTVEQGLDYPLVVLVDLFELPGARPADGPDDAHGGVRDPADYPRTARVTSVRGWGPR